MSQALHPMLNVAVKAARAAGAIINRASLDVDRVTVERKGPNDFVTEVDQAAEQAVIEVLLTAYPGHGILAEESGREHGSKDSEYLWIIDPLDGTTNFIHGFPVYATSIALAFRGKVEQAVVYDPTRNDLFMASKGRGAFLNDKRLRVSKRSRLGDALIGTGFPFRKGDNFKRYLKMFEEVMQQCAGLRRPGAAALDLCYVAAGWYDGFFETGLSPWDIAAGSLMVTEAGGLIGNFTGEADYLYQREIVAGNPKVYAQLVSLLKPYTRMLDKDETSPERSPARPPLAGTRPDATAAFVATHTEGTAAPADASAALPPKKPPVRIRKADADAEKVPAPKEVAPRKPAAKPASAKARATDPSIALREAFSPPEPEPVAQEAEPIEADLEAAPLIDADVDAGIDDASADISDHVSADVSDSETDFDDASTIDKAASRDDDTPPF